MTVQICTVSYTEYFVNSDEIIFSGALRSKGGDSKYCSKPCRGHISASFSQFLNTVAFKTIFKNAFFSMSKPVS